MTRPPYSSPPDTRPVGVFVSLLLGFTVGWFLARWLG